MQSYTRSNLCQIEISVFELLLILLQEVSGLHVVSFIAWIAVQQVFGITSSNRKPFDICETDRGGEEDDDGGGDGVGVHGKS